MINRSRSLKRLFPVFGVSLVASFALIALAAAGASALSLTPAPQSDTFAGGALNAESQTSTMSVSCSGSSGSGTWSSGTAATARLSLTGCVLPYYGFSCTTSGQAKGTILTKLLSLTPIYLNAAHTRYGLLITGEGASKAFATFNCAESRTWSGTVVAEITTPLNTGTNSFGLKFGNLGAETAFYLIEQGIYPGLSEPTYGGVSINTSMQMSTAGGGLSKFIP